MKMVVTVLLLVLLPVPAMACLDRDRAARTWPAKELTRDDDGCYTYWRKGLRHEQSAPVVLAPHNSGERLPNSNVAVAGADTLPDLIWIERWPARPLPEFRRVQVQDTPKPLLTTRGIALLIAIVIALFAIIQVAVGPELLNKIKPSKHDGYYT